MLYYVLFRVVIRGWNLKTSGQEDEEEKAGAEPGSNASVTADASERKPGRNGYDGP